MDLTIKLDANEALPLYRRLADALRQCIENGRLQPGDALPSTRQLAQTVGLSRITVVHSYDELISQGYLHTVPGSGTFVCNRPVTAGAECDQDSNQTASFHRPLATYGARISDLEMLESTSADLPELNFGAPPMDLLPLKQWRYLLLKHCRTHINKRMENRYDPLGYLPLRQAIAAYLCRSRNLKCSADMIAVFAGSQQTVNLTARLLINETDTVALENPGFVFARKTMRSIGAKILPIELDQEGIIVSDLSLHPDCKHVYVTPSHHDPTGIVMSMARRNELLQWAERQNGYIIEDDYDCEYNYETTALPSLQGLDRHESVIYISTFWKILFPLMPIGFVVVPRHLTVVLSRAKMLTERNFSMLEQYAMTDFINEGYLERHIRKTRKAFAHRRQTLISSLTRSLGNKVTVPKYSSGMHITIRFNLPLADSEIINLGKKSGLPLVSTQPYYISNGVKGEFLISFATQIDDDIAGRVANFAELLPKRITAKERP